MTAAATIRPVRRRQWRRRLPLIVMTAIFAVFLIVMIHALLTSKVSLSNDFYQRWRAAQIFWVEQINPYSRQASLEIEIGLYGAPADPAKGQYRGDSLYPFYDNVLLAPLVYLPYDWVEAFWMVFVAALCASVFLSSASVFLWHPPRWLLVIGIVWGAMLFYPSGRGILLGQVGTVAACLQVIAVWAIVKGHDDLAGVLLALSTVKPQPGILIVPFLGLWGLRYRRWRFVAAFTITFAVLMGVSFVLLPSWFGDWIGQIADYHSYNLVVSSVWVFTNTVLPFLGRAGELVISGIIACIMLWSWWRVLWRRDDSLFLWAVAFTFTATNLIMSPTATPQYVVFLFILVFYFREITRRPHGALIVLAIMIILTVVLWWFFVVTEIQRFENPLNYLPLPVLSLILLLTTRRWWTGNAAQPNVAVATALAPSK